MNGILKTILGIALFTAVAASVTGCATQRYGRLTELTAIERKELTCREVKIEIAKAEEFISDVRMQRADTN